MRITLPVVSAQYRLPVGIHGLSEHAARRRGSKLLASIRLQVQPIDLAPGTGCVGFTARAHRDRLGMVHAADVHDFGKLVRLNGEV